MLSPEEKRLLAGILALLLLGATIKSLRQHVSVDQAAKVELPSVDKSSKSRAKNSRSN